MEPFVRSREADGREKRMKKINTLLNDDCTTYMYRIRYLNMYNHDLMRVVQISRKILMGVRDAPKKNCVYSDELDALISLWLTRKVDRQDVNRTFECFFQI